MAQAPQIKIPATYMRGGTSKGVFFRDAVNVTARLASAASAGELLVTAATVKAAGLPSYGGERRRIVLRGKSEPTDVFVLGTSDPSRIT